MPSSDLTELLSLRRVITRKSASVNSSVGFLAALRTVCSSWASSKDIPGRKKVASIPCPRRASTWSRSSGLPDSSTLRKRRSCASTETSRTWLPSRLSRSNRVSRASGARSSTWLPSRLSALSRRRLASGARSAIWLLDRSSTCSRVNPASGPISTTALSPSISVSRPLSRSIPSILAIS